MNARSVGPSPLRREPAKVQWVISDFGGVVGLHQSAADLDLILRLANARSADDFWSSYWCHRQLYDAALITDEQYWFTIAKESGITVTHEAIASLVELDIASWLNPNETTLRVLMDVKRSGVNLALLSNAPLRLAKAIDRLEWIRPFMRRFYSSELHLLKPYPEVFRAVVDSLETSAEACVFIDDRMENVRGAAAVGMRGLHFSTAITLRRDLMELTSAAIESSE